MKPELVKATGAGTTRNNPAPPPETALPCVTGAEWQAFDPAYPPSSEMNADMRNVYERLAGAYTASNASRENARPSGANATSAFGTSLD